MFPGMVFAVLSRDPDFVQDVAVLLRNAGAEVFAAPPEARQVLVGAAAGSGRRTALRRAAGRRAPDGGRDGRSGS